METSETDDHGAPAWALRWARFVIRHRVWVLVAAIGATLFMVSAMKRLKVENGPNAVLSEDSEVRALVDEFRREFGQDEVFLVVAEGEVFSSGYLDRLKKLHDRFKVLHVATSGERPARKDAPAAPPADSFPGEPELGGWGAEAGGSIFEEVTSVVNVRRTRSVNGGLEVKGLLDRWPEAADLPALKAEVLSDPTLVGRIVGAAGRHSVVVLRTGFLTEADLASVHREIQKITAEHQADGFALHVAGLPALNASLSEMMERNLGRMFVLSILIVVVALGLTFRGVLTVLGPLGVIVQSVLWTLGAMALTGIPMTMLGTILPTFLICVGVCDSVHVQTVFRDLVRRGLLRDEALVRAVGSTIQPIFFTGLTTSLGLLGLHFAYLDAVKNLGRFGALGVMCAVVYSVTFLPAVLSFTRQVPSPATAARRLTLVDTVVGWAQRLGGAGSASSRRRAGFVLLGAAAATVVLGAFATRLGVEHNPLVWFPEDHPIRSAYAVADDHVGGSSDIALIVKTKQEGGLKNRDLLLGLEKVEGEVKRFALPGSGDRIVGNAVSVLDPVRETWRAVHGNDAAEYRVPPTEQGVVDMATLFESSAPDELRRLATIDLATALMVFRVRWMDATAYRPLLEHIESAAARFVGPAAEVKVTGTFYSNLTVVNNVMSDLLRSFTASFVTVALLVIVLTRSLRIGLVAMAPNVLPIFWVFGLMGLVGVPLNMSNLLIASIGLGTVVDDTIHFVHHFRVELARHGDVDRAIAATFDVAGRAVVVSSAVLVAGFSVFMTGTMQNVVHFGFLICAVVVLALIAELLVTPALLRLVFRKVSVVQASETGEMGHDLSVG